MNTIYEPSGKAKEYSPLALNLYNGCSHGCTYCYAPRCLHKTPENFRLAPMPRTGIIEQLKKDVKKFVGDTRPILMCFTGDPYVPVEATYKITRQAIEIMGEAGLKMKVLTKNGQLATRDCDLFKKYGVEVGQTIIFADDSLRQIYEPGASSIQSRFDAVRFFYQQGIKTWVSVEPVIYEFQALSVIDQLNPFVDHWKIGKLNHDTQREKEINWTKYLWDALNAVHPDSSYYVKDGIWAFADERTKVRFAKER